MHLWISGKQKFELLLLQFPQCTSSSTFDNRIMQPSCNKLEVHQIIPSSIESIAIAALQWLHRGFRWSTQIIAKMKLGKSVCKLWHGLWTAWVPQLINLRSFYKWVHQTYIQSQGLKSFLNDHLGGGIFPECDPWGNMFTADYYPARAALAGRPLSAEGFIGILEGIQADQDWLRTTFELTRGANRQLCCHYCNCVQWISTKDAHMYNDRNNLYTIFGPSEASRTSLI